jgi:FkbM family methyltransferase
MADFFRKLKDLRFRVFYGALLCRRYPLVQLGSRDCPWVLCPEGLGPESVIYSGGVGRDITFEHALVQNYGANIVLFDPTPTGLKTMALPENNIPQFKHHAVALAGQCGTLTFARPLDENEGSFFKASGGAATIEVPCVDLATLMRRNGHDHIDLLKIDIEGAEYEVIDDILKRRLPVKQVLVEFHNNLLPGIPRKQTVRSILKMVVAGYRLLKKDGENHTFFRPSRRSLSNSRKNFPTHL